MYHTTADEAIDGARSAVREAIAQLAKIVVEECSGSDEYKKEYYDMIKEVFAALIEIRERLK